jgi:putative inorganic carbon (HCO3(-)) transporter
LIAGSAADRGASSIAAAALRQLCSDDTWAEAGVAAAIAALAFAFYLIPVPVLYVPAFVALAALSWRRLDLALAVVVLLAPFSMLPKHIGHLEFAPTEILVILDAILAAGIAARPASRSRLHWHRLRCTLLLWPTGLFVLAALVSTVAAADRHLALRYFREWVAEPALFFALLVLVEVRFRQWCACFAAILGAGLVVGAVALVQRVTHQDLTVDVGSTIEKVKAVYGSPDNVGLFYDRVIPVWLATLAVVKDRVRLATWLAVGLILLSTLFLTYSRGAWLAIAITCLLMLTLMYPWGRWLALAVLLIGLGGLAVRGPSIARAFSSGHNGTVQQRLYIWHSALRMGADHLLFGVGLDNFQHYYAPKTGNYLPCNYGEGYLDPRAAQEPCLSHPHDVVLDLWLSTGIAGLGAFVWLQFLFWRTCIRALCESLNGQRALVLGAAGAMLAGLIHGLVDNSYFLTDLALLFWLLCAFMVFVHDSLDIAAVARKPAGSEAR